MKPLACALAIGGLDPGGGAGLLADLRAFAAAGVFGCAAAAVLTVQSTAGLVSARAVSPREVLLQAREVIRVQRVRAIKVGALGTGANVRAVADLLASSRGVPAVVDTPMRATKAKRGARLLDDAALVAMREALLPRATLVTANVPEVEALLGVKVSGVSAAHDAAIALCRLGATAALVKGGHMSGAASVDVLAVGGEVTELRAKRLALPSAHGTGCTFASLIAGRLAATSNGRATTAKIVDAVRWAKRVHYAALSKVRDVGGDQRVVTFG